jgi:putative DNA methylase
MAVDKQIKLPRRLIEVAIPLDDINEASAKEKAVKVGKPTSLHHWFAPRTLTAARAILFAQMVSDPGGERGYSKGKTKKQANQEREDLFNIIRELIDWSNYDNPSVLNKAAAIIEKDWKAIQDQLGTSESLPAFLDPFCGRGTLPLEAQCLGLQVFASDLNPIPVLINKSLIDYPKRFRGRPPVSKKQKTLSTAMWKGVSGLIADIEFYSAKLLDSVKDKAGDVYPKAKHNGTSYPVVAWLWARTVRSPNPAFSECHVPLISNYVLCAKPTNKATITPVVNGKKWRFEITTSDSSPSSSGTVGRKGATCILSGTPIPLEHIRNEGKAGRLGTRLIAIVADTGRGRAYLPADANHEEAANLKFRQVLPIGDIQIDHWPGCTNSVVYGYDTFLSLFTERQRFVLSLFCKELKDVSKQVLGDAVAAGVQDAEVYARAITTYLAMAISRTADWNNSFSRWESKAQVPQQLFGRHTITMCWDYAEANPLHSSTGSFSASVVNIVRALKKNVVADHVVQGSAVQNDAAEGFSFISRPVVVSTDPPYYDNIPYSNLADFFYVWLRTMLSDDYPELFATMATPKQAELVANKFRHGGKDNAQEFFINGMRRSVAELVKIASPYFPMTIYYAFKQKEDDDDGGEVSTGWETFLESLTTGGLQITGTWPLRTEGAARMMASNKNALASSIVLVCRKRPAESPSVSRREFVRELNQVLPEALDEMTRGVKDDQSPVAPVDLSQAIIGPGMAVYSKYSSVLEADGTPMTVRAALQIINRFLAEDDFDRDTQFCLHWFEQHGWDTSKFGEADTLARAKGTSVDGVKQAGVLLAAGGKVRLLKWAEYSSDWDPQSDQRLPIWEVLHQLIRVFNTNGEAGAASVFAAVQSKAEAARQLAYRLYTLCERKNWAEDARAYNEVVTSWSGIESAAAKEPAFQQKELFD